MWLELDVELVCWNYWETGGVFGEISLRLSGMNAANEDQLLITRKQYDAKYGIWEIHQFDKEIFSDLFSIF